MKRKLVSLICVISLALILIIIGCAPSPESLAAATATIMKANAIATSDSLNAEAQATRQRMDTHATATAIPLALGITAAAATRDSVGVWVTLFGWSFAVLVLLAFGAAVVSMARTRAKIVPRDKSGQLQAFWDGYTLTDPSRMIGPAATMQRQPDVLWQIARVVHYLKTGKVQDPPPTQPPQMNDGGADADHLLAAAQSANTTTAIAATFAATGSDRERKQRFELTKKAGTTDWLGRQTPPQTRVLVQGNDAIQIIAEQLGDCLPCDAIPPALPMPPSQIAPSADTLVAWDVIEHEQYGKDEDK